MLDPQSLVTLEPGLPDLGTPVLVSALEGFVDAGSALRLVREHLVSTSEPRLVASFDADQLVDYRARRPLLRFDRDHWASLALPRIDVHALTDRSGQAYLLMTGPEPDVQWQRFAAAVELLVRELRVRLVVGLDAVPLAVPHTRPLGLTAHASRPELVAGHQAWFDEALVPGSVGHAVEYLLARAGHDTAGFAVHVPQYLAQAEYPQAALRLVEALGEAPGLSLDVEALEVAAQVVAVKVQSEASESAEIGEMIAGLEQQYDAFVAARADSALLAEGRLPSADELGSEFERFLAEQTGKESGEG
ncbi:putative ATP-grasp superfamily ATP-dependent carboligase [Motilibacter peucedani]|uniref:Putative ATP-grasp superfamily ATP-dependent carboligase n=1 Tax=Motilibacter peucedani TaxID=598650 RepID=A0A420XRX1_9ACTN|nr:PAC2 family protein [Motilibacter peucedani]RKS77551.1 putative ATP-grasp superfamily ATP-dependent carboligase [Motilibacter peucedani]